MKRESIFVRRIFPVDEGSFGIEWTDGKMSQIPLQNLQKICTCAKCSEKGTQDLLQSKVGAKRVYSIGRYALAVEFNSGCSKGIYPFALLRKVF